MMNREIARDKAPSLRDTSPFTRSLGFGLALVLAISLTAIANSWFGMRTTQMRLAQLFNTEQALYGGYTELYAQGLQMGQALRNYLLDTGDATAQRNYQLAQASFSETLSFVQKIAGKDDQNRLASVVSLSARQFELDRRIMALASAGKQGEALNLLVVEGVPAWRSYKQILLEDRGRLASRVEDEQARVSDFVTHAGAVSLIAGVLAMLVALTTTHFLSRAIRRREERLAQQSETQLRQTQLLDAVVHSLHDPVLVIGSDYRVLMNNRAVRKIARPGGEQLQGSLCHELLHGLDRPCHEYDRPCPLKDISETGRPTFMMSCFDTVERSQALFDVAATPVFNASGQVEAIVECLHDVTFDLTARVDLQLSKEKLFRQVHLDSLTGLPNRVGFESEISGLVRQALHHDQALGLIFVDLDGFKEINDTLGHPQGDELLRIIARRLQSSIRQSDFVGRLAGDEFVLILPNLGDRDALSQVAENVLTACRSPLNLAGNSVHVSGSLGIAIYPEDADNSADLIKYADIAMYSAKAAGRDVYRFFRPPMDNQWRERFELSQDIKKAVERGEFFLEYQPQFDASGTHLRGVEALMRWRSPTRGIVPPNRFIPWLEESGQLGKLGGWLLDEALGQSARWRQAGLPPLIMSINLSFGELDDEGLPSRIEAALRRHRVPPECLEVEITERMAMSNPERVADLLDRIRSLGVRTAMDDFGTGYSSLSYLTHLPIDTLKIDRAFISVLPHSEKSRGVINLIAGLGKVLGMEVVAEGVEIEEELVHVRDAGCHSVQGYLFARPLSPERISERFIAAQPVQPELELTESPT